LKSWLAFPKGRSNGAYEFHISRQARNRYGFDDALFGISGNVIFADFYAVRVFTEKVNRKRNLLDFPEQAVKASQVNAMGLIDEILHMVVGLYRQQIDPNVWSSALGWIIEELGEEAVLQALYQFSDLFPSTAVYRQEMDVTEYLEAETEGMPNRLIVLEEMLLLWLANVNPAFTPFKEFFDDTQIDQLSAYSEIMKSLHNFFNERPRFGPDNQNLIDMLRSPTVAVPYSLSGQLEYILTRWADLLGKYLYRLLGGLDFIKEEEKAIFLGPGIPQVYDFSGLDFELERFSQDKDWMPRLVLIAKNTYVWLDQLSKKYQCDIHRLDQVPDEELDAFARWGFTGLWLIGLWERSQASRKIKQMMGNPDAIASAYSLYDYTIAADLGGEEALRNLRGRAWKRGIRLASDMVPNHMGIDSRWVIEHPKWFLSLPYSPFPSYSFSGIDLCEDGRIGVYLDDHYFDKTDAAVSFKRVDHNTGETHFIYHGNDGTSMPWNDTAQLNFLNPEVREAVIQTILHVARQFPVIRFDAAMTLAKRHIQRLWFPEPGGGGAIPSRAEHGLTKEQFEAVIPKEFWREVVDRVAEEVPETLLLAEAFWMMEGYFVRTLGMHRVYNSAFMHMLRDEDNAKYRSVMKNTLEFDPRILKRFVNFMSNPDEETAVAQFGKDNKYFGVCTLMITLPGLPMFGHGQIQGFSEKYGMEYRYAKWDEIPDEHLVKRHESQIFPLLHKRYLFADVENFLLYDFFTPEGHVNEDVFAYSNRYGDERALIVYHNKYADTRGWVKKSVGYVNKNEHDKKDELIQQSLAAGLEIPDNENTFVIFRDYVNRLEYIRNCRDVVNDGLYVELDGYRAFVFLDFRFVFDDGNRRYAHLTEYLAGRGVPSIEEALREVVLKPVHFPFRELINAEMTNYVVGQRVKKPEDDLGEEFLQQVKAKMEALLFGIRDITQFEVDVGEITTRTLILLEAALRIEGIGERFGSKKNKEFASACELALLPFEQEEQRWPVLIHWIFIHVLGRAQQDDNYNLISITWLDEWLLGKLVARVYQDMGLDEGKAWHQIALLRLLIAKYDWFRVSREEGWSSSEILRDWLSDPLFQQYIQVNRYQGILWFNKEVFEDVLWWLYAITVIQVTSKLDVSKNQIKKQILLCYEFVKFVMEALAESEYKVERLLEIARDN
jgi:glycosidase